MSDIRSTRYTITVCRASDYMHFLLLPLKIEHLFEEYLVREGMLLIGCI